MFHRFPFIAPGVDPCICNTRILFPFGFSWQTRTMPFTISFRHEPVYKNNRIIIEIRIAVVPRAGFGTTAYWGHTNTRMHTGFVEDIRYLIFVNIVISLGSRLRGSFEIKSIVAAHRKFSGLGPAPLAHLRHLWLLSACLLPANTSPGIHPEFSQTDPGRYHGWVFHRNS